MGRLLFRFKRLLLHHVLHADDTPHAIALGVAIATVIAFLPLVGIQTAIAIGVAAIFRANKAVCVPIVWITNPLTLVPIYGACLALGRSLISTSDSGGEVAVLAALDAQPFTWDLLELEWWKSLFIKLVDLGLELWIGCALVGVTLGALSYVLSRWGVVAYRDRRRRRLLERSLFRAEQL